jgi:hypothetical protein
MRGLAQRRAGSRALERRAVAASALTAGRAGRDVDLGDGVTIS